MTIDQNQPIIVGFVADLMFTTRIENVARRLGFQMKWIESAATLAAVSDQPASVRPGESLVGPSGELFRRLSDWQPALLLFDLGNEAIPWQKWLPRLKSSPATRRIPILCYGSHVDVETMTEAKRLGADAVLARSRFTSDMPNLLQKYVRTSDQDAIAAACQEPLPDLARRGLALFNQGEYYKCHDDLEEAWRQDEGDGRILYQGILQTGIALYQIERGNYRGAVKMLLRLRQWLDPLPDTCRGVDVAGVRKMVTAVHEAVQSLGPEQIDQFDWSLVQPIQYR
jgi:predicted metal-dependent hydrolase